MGCINIDLVMYMDSMPVPGETIFTDNFNTYPGGKGGNQAATAAALGADVKFFTKLGDDDFSKKLTKELVDRGVDMKHVIYEKDETSGVAMIRVDREGQNSISFTSGANGKLTPKDIEENSRIFEESDILLITMEIPLETVYAAINMAKSKGMIVVLDPAPAPKGGLPADIASKVDYTKPNETETEILCGVKVDTVDAAKKGLRELNKFGFATPIITLADRGALALIDGNEYYVEPIKVNSIDSTAAGDIFLGAFTAALARGEDILECLNFAKTAAALSTTKKGAQTSIPQISEIAQHRSHNMII
jgi:ribokinase